MRQEAMKSDKLTIDDPRAKREVLRRQGIRLSILTSAENIITTKGYTAMTMDDVARAACLSKATLYKYIPSKEQVLFEILCRYLDEEEVKLRRILDSGAGASEKLRAIVSGAIHLFQTKSNLSHIMMLDKATFKFMRLLFDSDDKAGSERFRKSVNVLKKKKLGLMKLSSQVIEEGVVSGEFRAVDPMETVFFINSFLGGISHNWFWRKGMVDLPEDKLSEKSFVFILSSLRKRNDNCHTESRQVVDKTFMNAPGVGRKESKNA
jgi:AcrR family transcriptional regulator